MSFSLRLGENNMPESGDVAVGVEEEAWAWFDGLVRHIQQALENNLRDRNSDFCTTHVRNGREYVPIEPILKPYHVVWPSAKVLHTTVPETFSWHYLFIEVGRELIRVFLALRPGKN